MKEPIIMNILNNDTALDMECWACKNPKTPNCHEEDGVCRLCSGTGFILTDAGESIMKLIIRHSKHPGDVDVG